MPLIRNEKSCGKQLRPLFNDGSDYSIPAINIKETENSFKIELAIPGVNKEHLKINLDQDLLTVFSDEKVQTGSDNESYKRREFVFSQFSRSFRLPQVVNTKKIRATQENGILTIELPKQKEEKISKTIQVN